MSSDMTKYMKVIFRCWSDIWCFLPSKILKIRLEQEKCHKWEKVA